MEIWKDIRGYEGLYMVSDLARIKRLFKIEEYIYNTDNTTTPTTRVKDEKIISQSNHRKYKVVGLCKDGIYKSKRVHILVAKEFVPNPDNKPEVNHLDGVKFNNLPYNLVWSTRKENAEHAVNVLGIGRGESGSKAKLKESDVIEIRASKKRVCDLAREYNITPTSINYIIKRKNWKHL